MEAEAALQVAREVRRKKGRSRGNLMGPDGDDEQMLEDLAQSWESFAKKLKKIAKHEEQVEEFSEATQIWFLAQTEHLLTVKIDKDPYMNSDAVIEIGGEVVKPIPGNGMGGPIGVIRFRDGGTTIITTSKGKIIVPAQHKQDNGIKPTIDGELLYPTGKI